MPYYRRAYVPGGTFFFTLVTENRAPILCDNLGRSLLHKAIAECRRRRPFAIDAMVLLPDHLHMMMTLPPGDANFSLRMAALKAYFTRAFLLAGGTEQARSESRIRKRRRGVWQRWFWEHTIRDREDHRRHFDYIHYNPVKHAVARCAHDWPYSTFHRHADAGVYTRQWQCACDGRVTKPMAFDGLDVEMIECEESERRHVAECERVISGIHGG